MIDRKIFYEDARPLYGSYAQPQVDGINHILDEAERRGLTDMRHLAYMLATVLHETAKTMQPVREYGSEAYLRSKAYYPWAGEGLVQVTWEANHRKFGATAPGQLLTWPACLVPLFDGMTKGMFTGKKLADYFHGSTADALNARRIINGLDKAVLIASYYRAFFGALTEASA
jgi:putative chitinase